ncbi:MAG: metallophosphatase domain-containing protein [Myxococcales bacterium]|nr:metallophosphatase domain-containing protein [Myxococcales bacterium]
MRIVAVADTHLYHRELRVPDGDVFVHAGDLCQSGHVRELAMALDWVAELPHRRKVVIAGNHDWAFVRDRQRALGLIAKGVDYLEDDAIEIDGVRFWGSPWQPEFCAWAFNLPRGKALADKWARMPDGVDVLVTHGPPRGIGDRAGTARREGCEDLLARVEAVKPRLHLFGHIHEDGGAWQVGGTWFANVTTWESDRAPTVFDLDLATKSVTPVIVPAARRETA